VVERNFSLSQTAPQAWTLLEARAARLSVEEKPPYSSVYTGSDFFHPESRIQCQKDSRSQIRIKEFKYF
jgi:hypothetical protein